MTTAAEAPSEITARAIFDDLAHVIRQIELRRRQNRTVEGEITTVHIRPYLRNGNFPAHVNLKAGAIDPQDDLPIITIARNCDLVVRDEEGAIVARHRFTFEGVVLQLDDLPEELYPTLEHPDFCLGCPICNS